MKRLVLSLTIAAAAAGFSISADAEEREIIYTAKGKNIYRAAESAAQRTRSGSYQAAVRAQYDGHINRDEGLATAREEHRGPVVAVHCDLNDWSTIYLGHALTN